MRVQRVAYENRVGWQPLSRFRDDERLQCFSRCIVEQFARTKAFEQIECLIDLTVTDQQRSEFGERSIGAVEIRNAQARILNNLSLLLVDADCLAKIALCRDRVADS